MAAKKFGLPGLGQNGDIVGIKNVLAQGADVNEQDVVCKL